MLSHFEHVMQNFIGGNGGNMPNSLWDAAANASLDLNQLQGLAPDQIFEILSRSNIDLSQFALDEVRELLGNLSGGGLLGPVGEYLGGDVR